jgi:hypothetical protein
MATTKLDLVDCHIVFEMTIARLKFLWAKYEVNEFEENQTPLTPQLTMYELRAPRGYFLIYQKKDIVWRVSDKDGNPAN